MVSSLLTYRLDLRRTISKKSKKQWYKVRRKINKYLRVARRIADYSIQNRGEKITSKTVKHLGKIPSSIANQTVKKYKNNFKCKTASNVNLIVPACSTVKYPSVTYDEISRVLTIKPLKLSLHWYCPIWFNKICQVELNNRYCYITVSVENHNKKEYKNKIGVDLNIKHNLATVGNPKTKEVNFLGKDFIYRRAKYKAIRQRWQKQGRLNKIKQMNNKEQRVMRNLNHQLSRDIINIAKKDKAIIAVENLKGIRQNAKSNRSFCWFLHSWAFYQLRQFLEYKTLLEGLEVVAVDPKYTSQDCSSCGERTKCNGKWYRCSHCHLEIHRDENASYNVAKR